MASEYGILYCKKCKEKCFFAKTYKQAKDAKGRVLLVYKCYWCDTEIKLTPNKAYNLPRE